MLPSDLLDLQREGMEFGVMSVDTETSGLYADDGARVSTLSLAFVHPKDKGLPNSAFKMETVCGEKFPIYSFAWPFDQGVAGTGKPEDDGQLTLWQEANNLSSHQWRCLLELLLNTGNQFGLIMHNSKFPEEGCTDHNCHGTVESWPLANEDTSAPSDTKTASAKNVNTKTTKKGDPNRGSGTGPKFDVKSFNTTAGDVSAVEKNGKRSSSSTTSTATEQTIDSKSTKVDPEAEDTGHTGGSSKTTSRLGIKSSAPIATLPKNAAGVHQTTCSECGCRTRPAGGLVMHHAKFDCEKIREGVRRWPHVGVDLMDQVVWDTQNANHYLYPLERTSLKPTVERLFGTEYGDESRIVKDYLKKKKLPTGRWDLMPWDIIGEYADMDARITLMLYFYQIADIESRDLDPQERTKIYDALNRRLDTTRVLYRMERRGIPYDEISSRDAAALAKKRATEALVGLPYKTDAQAKAYYFGNDEGQLGMVPYAVSDKTGEPSMTAEILQRMVDDEVPYIKQWAEHRKAKSAASMWYEAYADAIGSDGRIRTCFRQNGTTSSRFSVERINLQAIPQDYRLSSHSVLEGIPTPRAIIAKAVEETMPGWSLWELDLAQAELRVGAMFAKCTPMLNMINAGQDLHDYTTKALFDIGPDDEEFFRYRQVGKRANFSLLFGAGGNTFRKMVSKETGIQLGEAEAERLVREWNGLYPHFGVAIDSHSFAVARRQAKTGRGWVKLTDNERRWFDKYEDTHKAFNQRVQGNLAQFGISWMIESDAYLKDIVPDGLGESGLVLTIHDSQVLLLPDDEGEEMANQCARFGTELWKKYFAGVPGGVDAKKWGK